jgi:beta-carotene hydroxylase
MHSLWPIFMNSPYLFRRVHLLHHAHVNQGEKDPDHFTQAHTLFDRWLKSFFLLSNYFVYGLKFINRDWKDRLHLMLSPGIPILILMSLPFIPHAAYVFWGWVAPAYVGIGFLAYANTALPHQPGIEIDRFRNTRNLRMPWILETLMWHQNLHLIHHLHPTLPWYRYKEYYRENADWLKSKGAETGVYSQRPLV